MPLEIFEEEKRRNSGDEPNLLEKKSFWNTKFLAQYFSSSSTALPKILKRNILSWPIT